MDSSFDNARLAGLLLAFLLLLLLVAAGVVVVVAAAGTGGPAATARVQALETARQDSGHVAAELFAGSVSEHLAVFPRVSEGVHDGGSAVALGAVTSLPPSRRNQPLDL